MEAWHIGGWPVVAQRRPNYSERSTQMANIEKIKIILDWKGIGMDRWSPYLKLQNFANKV